MSAYDLINCKLIKNKRHLLENAKLLPCGNTGCLKCILKVMNKTNYFKCNFQNCKERHILIDTKSLPVNQEIDDYILSSIKVITEEISKNGNNLSDELRGIIKVRVTFHGQVLILNFYLNKKKLTMKNFTWTPD